MGRASSSALVRMSENVWNPRVDFDKNSRAKIVFQESIRQGNIISKNLTPAISTETKYKIFYIDEDNFKKSLIEDSSSLSLPPESSVSDEDRDFYKSRLDLYNYLKKQDSKFNLTKWENKTVTCEDKKCTFYLNDLEEDKYRIIISTEMLLFIAAQAIIIPQLKVIPKNSWGQ